MSILVVGSVALDSVETPFGKADDALGGSATFFSASASYFSPINVVGVVGSDFPHNELEFLKTRNVSLDGIKTEEGKTFRWGGKYHVDMNQRDTLFTALNVFEHFKPVIPGQYKNSEYVFLGNIAPTLQLDVLAQIDNPKLVALDTMNFWISGMKESLVEVIKKVDIILINDQEAKELTDKTNLVQAANAIFELGPQVVVIKKGEHGALLFTKQGIFSAPALPMETVCDPTGAGDSFAGGFIGYLAHNDVLKNGVLDESVLRKAMIYGSVMASFSIEDFSLEKLKDLSSEEISNRYIQFVELASF
ncbi:MAG: sugar kinase [Calditrichaeota bacterium]|nr:MAG: sugar kinase [Calditrichota bacterium]